MYQGLGMFFGVFQSKSIRKNARVSVVFCRTVWYSDKKRKNAKRLRKAQLYGAVRESQKGAEPSQSHVQGADHSRTAECGSFGMGSHVFLLSFVLGEEDLELTKSIIPHFLCNFKSRAEFFRSNFYRFPSATLSLGDRSAYIFPPPPKMPWNDQGACGGKARE